LNQPLPGVTFIAEVTTKISRIQTIFGGLLIESTKGIACVSVQEASQD
jgi:hypothetical protein